MCWFDKHDFRQTSASVLCSWAARTDWHQDTTSRPTPCVFAFDVWLVMWNKPHKPFWYLRIQTPSFVVRIYIHINGALVCVQLPSSCLCAAGCSCLMCLYVSILHSAAHFEKWVRFSLLAWRLSDGGLSTTHTQQLFRGSSPWPTFIRPNPTRPPAGPGLRPASRGNSRELTADYWRMCFFLIEILTHPNVHSNGVLEVMQIHFAQ